MDALFDRVGGEQFFFDLIDSFYLGVAGDPLLRPLYPEDLTEPKHHLALFLVQYWGGPSTYNETRGHPRLRMRHAPFIIGPAERDAWLRHMNAAVARMVETQRLTPPDAEELDAYFVMAAQSLLNAP
ncbi:MAG TPA: globin [Acidimicrobiales bacterium]|nr:globin [Acidimicrobiales bacterium]